MKATDVLLVDDDESLAMITMDMLIDYGYEVKWIASAEEAYEWMQEQMPKLIVLDINLPGDSGFDLCKELRLHSTVPIIFVSARTSEDDRVTGLDLGADDYLPKPYSLVELLSRIKANLRRTYGFSNEEVINSGELTVKTATREVLKNGNKITLSLKEYDLLLYLLKHPNQALAKETLLTEVWGAFSEVELSTVAVHMRWLREKLETDPSKPEHLKTVWGIGYQYCP